MQRPASPSAWRPCSLLLAATAAGALTGLAETSILEVQRLVLGRIVFLGRHAWWMKPVAEAALFLLVMLVVILTARLVRRPAGMRLPISVIAALAAMSILLLVPRIHPVARALLAVGIGFQLGRWLDRALAAREPLGRKLAAAVIVLAFGVAGGVTALERAIAPAPWTLPSHASMFTGREAHRLSTDWRRPLDDSERTIAEGLASAGYRTAGFVANMAYAGWETGLDRGFHHYEDHPVSFRQLIVESSIARLLLGTDLARRLAGRDENFVRKSARDDGEPRGGFSPLHRWLDEPFESRDLVEAAEGVAVADSPGQLLDERLRTDR